MEQLRKFPNSRPTTGLAWMIVRETKVILQPRSGSNRSEPLRHLDD